MGASHPVVAAISCEVTSLGEAATTFMDDSRRREIIIDKGYSERDDIDLMSCGSMSPDLCSGSEDGIDHEFGGRHYVTDGAAEGPKDYISDVRESALWASLRDCFTPAASSLRG